MNTDKPQTIKITKVIDHPLPKNIEPLRIES